MLVVNLIRFQKSEIGLSLNTFVEEIGVILYIVLKSGESIEHVFSSLAKMMKEKIIDPQIEK